jgi:hypothetical protein
MKQQVIHNILKFFIIYINYNYICLIKTKEKGRKKTFFKSVLCCFSSGNRQSTSSSVYHPSKLPLKDAAHIASSTAPPTNPTKNESTFTNINNNNGKSSFITISQPNQTSQAQNVDQNTTTNNSNTRVFNQQTTEADKKNQNSRNNSPNATNRRSNLFNNNKNSNTQYNDNNNNTNYSDLGQPYIQVFKLILSYF